MLFAGTSPPDEQASSGSANQLAPQMIEARTQRETLSGLQLEL
jgi:hypothetical protein